MGVLDESRTRLARFITAGVDESARRRIGSPPTRLGVLGELIRNPVPLRLANVGRHLRSYGFAAGHPPMESFLGVGDGCGVSRSAACLSEKPGARQFSELDEQTLVGLSVLVHTCWVALSHA